MFYIFRVDSQISIKNYIHNLECLTYLLKKIETDSINLRLPHRKISIHNLTFK